MKKAKQTSQAELEALGDVLVSVGASIFNSTKLTGNEYSVSFNQRHLATVEDVIPVGWSLPSHKNGNTWQLYGKRVVELFRDARTRSDKYKPSIETMIAPEGQPPRNHKHEGVKQFTFSDGQTIKMCPNCSNPFTSSEPLTSFDNNRRAVLCGGL